MTTVTAAWFNQECGQSVTYAGILPVFWLSILRLVKEATEALTVSFVQGDNVHQ